jgi:uncharacterized membrane protein
MRRRSIGMKSVLFLSIFIIFSIAGAATVLAQADKDKDVLPRPERGIAIYTEFSGVIVPPGESVRMELTADNKGKRDENISMKISQVPKGWRASLKAPNFTVDAVPVPATKTRTLTFLAEPDKTVKPGNYLFQIDARTEDGQFTATQKINVTVREKTAMGEDFTVTTSYPVLKGQTDAKFEFSLEVNNKSEVDRNFNLSAQAPPKWEINFKPAYEQKQISSFRIKGGSSQTVAVEVTPPKDAQSGSFPIVVGIASGDKKQDVKLTVVLTGIYKLDAGTPTGLLSLEALAGKAAQMSLFVKNTGSAVNQNISFSSFKPENWKVEFKPEQMETLPAGELKQVEVIITPAAQALVGDYSVGIGVQGEKANKSLELRVTVKASTAWGWIGIGIIVLVVLGLVVLFVRMGRR